MRRNSKNKKHLDALHILDVNESYVIECDKSEIVAFMGLARNVSLLKQEKLFSCTSYTAIPSSMVQEHIYILKFLRKT
jgi:hypothetical protein